MVTTGTAPAGRARAAGVDWHRVAVLTLAGVLLLALGYQVWISATHPLGVFGHWGADYTGYMNATRTFLDGGSFYTTEPIVTEAQRIVSIFYPPIVLLLFIPMSLLPAVAWWLVPVGTIAYVAYRQCLTDWQRVALLAALASGFIVPLVSGNGTLWVAAAIVAGNRWGWPAAFIVIKPTLAPWALIGIRSRSWWVATAGLGLASLALLPMWFDWARVILGYRDGGYYLAALLSPGLLLLWFATRQPARAIYVNLIQSK